MAKSEELPKLTVLKDAHRRLYGGLLERPVGADAEAEDPTSKFVSQIKDLLDDIRRLSPHVDNTTDYTWLLNTSLLWQIAFSTLLNIPERFEMPKPPTHIPEPPSPSSEDWVDSFIKSTAGLVSVYRRAKAAEAELKRTSKTHEEEADWFHAKLYLCDQVLSGTVDFVRSISKESYYHLEDIWLRDIIQLKAYLLWEQRRYKQPQSAESAKKNYVDACEIYWMLLENQNNKKRAAEFFDVQSYIVDKYFTGSPYHFDEEKIKVLINGKANEFWNRGFQTQDDKKRNWHDAEEFVRGFYGNIIPAVTVEDPTSCELVHKAILLSEWKGDSRLSIMNGLEAAISIYFLRGFKRPSPRN